MPVEDDFGGQQKLTSGRVYYADVTAHSGDHRHENVLLISNNGDGIAIIDPNDNGFARRFKSWGGVLLLPTMNRFVVLFVFILTTETKIRQLDKIQNGWLKCFPWSW